jgi:hypothetical protein
MTAVDGNQYMSNNFGQTWITLNNAQIVDGEYLTANDKFIFKNTIFNPSDLTYSEYINEDIDQVIIIDDDLIHLHNSNQNSASYIMNNELLITELSPSPIGTLFRGPNRVSTFVIDYNDDIVYYRPDLLSEYNAIDIITNDQYDIISASTDDDNVLFFLLEDENGIRTVQRANFNCNESSVVIEREIEVTICEGDNYNGYTQTGIYSDNFVTSSGCDSIVHLNLIVEQQVSESIKVQICEGQNFQELTESGNYTIEDNTVEGCPTELSLELTVLPISNDTTLTLDICQGDIYRSYTENGTYVDTSVYGNTCYTEQLTINVLQHSSKEFIKYLCEGESFLGHTEVDLYIDTLTNSKGCDSIITTKLNRRIPYIMQFEETICTGDNYNGRTMSGQYVDSYTAIDGCDSIVIVDLKVVDEIHTVQREQLCVGDSIRGHEQTGFYIDTLSTSHGCDSIIELHLDISDCYNNCGEGIYIGPLSYYGLSTSEAKFVDNKLLIYYRYNPENQHVDITNKISVYEFINNEWTISNFPVLPKTSDLFFLKNKAISFLRESENSLILWQNENDIWKSIQIETGDNKIIAANIGPEYISYSNYSGLYIINHLEPKLQPVKISDYRVDYIEFLNEYIICRRRTPDGKKLIVFNSKNGVWERTEITSKHQDTQEFARDIDISGEKLIINSGNYVHQYTITHNIWKEQILKFGQSYNNVQINKDILSYETGFNTEYFHIESIDSSNSLTTSFKILDYIYPFGAQVRLGEANQSFSVSDSFIVVTFRDIGASLSGEYFKTIPRNSFFEDRNNDGFADRNNSISDTIQVTICQGQSYEGYTVTGTYEREVTSFRECTESSILELTVLDAIHPDCFKLPSSSDDEIGHTPIPNPFDSWMRILVHDDIGEFTVTITDIKGRIVKQYQEDNMDSRVDLTDLDKGLYILRLNNERYNAVSSIVKI